MKSFLHLVNSNSKFLFLLFFTVAYQALNAQQASLTVQGVLTKSDGTAVDDGEYSITFRLWNDPTSTAAANKKHEETINNVETVGGVYSAILGINGTPLNADFSEVYYLGVSMNSSTVELLPRPRLTHAPYALSIRGNSNVFPSTGSILGDAFRVKGGNPQGGPNGNGFSFQGATGDESGGMFSNGANNISLYAGGQQKIKLSSGLNELLGPTNTNQLTVFGTLTSNDLTVNGSSTITVDQTVQNNQNVNGYQTCLKQFLTPANGGYSFTYDGSYDTGLFGESDGNCSIKTNGRQVFKAVNNGNGEAHIGPGIPTHAQLQVSESEMFVNTSARFFNDVIFQNLPPKPGGSINPKNIAFNLNDGKLFWENSSRRFKHNIRPLQDDFSLILKAQPHVYNRFVDGKPDFSYEELGYVAEEMDSIGLHKLVQHDKDGQIDGFDYEKMILYVVEVLKTQDAAVNSLNTEVEALKAENAKLLAQNKQLQASNEALTTVQANFSAQLETLAKRMQHLETAGVSGNTKK